MQSDPTETRNWAADQAGDQSGRRTPFLEALHTPGPLHTVELRPPPAGLSSVRSLDHWIDVDRAVRPLLASGRFVLFTDDAVGDREEESLRHLTANLGPEASLSNVVPFLTCKHTLEYCLLFARRAQSHGLGAVTVTGGDRSVGPPRCLPRSRDLRARIREENGVDLPLGTWVNPYRDAEEQVDLLLDPEHHADYFLTQVVSHHDLEPLGRFLEEADRRNVKTPGLVGVFFYRSANPKTLEKLSHFIPVSADELTREFEAGASPEVVCARTVSSLRKMGVEKVYVSNLALRGAEKSLRRVEELVEAGEE